MTQSPIEFETLSEAGWRKIGMHISLLAEPFLVVLVFQVGLGAPCRAGLVYASREMPPPA